MAEHKKLKGGCVFVALGMLPASRESRRNLLNDRVLIRASHVIAKDCVSRSDNLEMTTGWVILSEQIQSHPLGHVTRYTGGQRGPQNFLACEPEPHSREFSTLKTFPQTIFQDQQTQGCHDGIGD